MIRSIITAALCLLVTISSVNSEEINKPAPDFALPDINNKEHKLSDYQDKVVLIVWSSIKTKDDNKKFKEAFYKKYPDEDFSGKGNLVYISIFDFTDKPFYAPMSLMKKMIKDAVAKSIKEGTHKHLFLTDFEGKFRKLYNHPKERNVHLYIVDKKGLIKYHYSGGFSPEAVDKANEIISQLIERK